MTDNKQQTSTDVPDRLQGLTAIVTGGANGIGLGIAAWLICDRPLGGGEYRVADVADGSFGEFARCRSSHPYAIRHAGSVDCSLCERSSRS